MGEPSSEFFGALSFPRVKAGDPVDGQLAQQVAVSRVDHQERGHDQDPSVQGVALDDTGHVAQHNLDLPRVEAA